MLGVGSSPTVNTKFTNLVNTPLPTRITVVEASGVTREYRSYSNEESFANLKRTLESCNDNSTLYFPSTTVVGSASITVKASGIQLFFNGLKISRSAENAFVIQFGGNNNKIHHLNVDGGLDRLGDKPFRNRNVALVDSGRGNQYISCSAGFCPKGSLASGWELKGQNTILKDCVSRESGSRNFRILGDGIRCLNCESYHQLDRPAFEGTSLRRHFSGVGTRARQFQSLLISGGKWVSDFQWTSSVFDANGVPGGKVRGGSLNVLRIENLTISYGPNTSRSTGSPNVSVAKFDAIKQVELQSITEEHSLPNVMFANVSSNMNLLLTAVKTDGYIAYSHTKSGGAGGHLRITNCAFGENGSNKSAVAGFQTNSAKNKNSIESVVISNSWFRVVGNGPAVFWNESAKNNYWKLNNVTIDHVGSKSDFIWKNVARFGQVSQYNLAVTGKNRSRVFLATTPAQRLAASAESNDPSNFRYDFQILRYEPPVGELSYGKPVGLSKNNKTSASASHPVFWKLNSQQTSTAPSPDRFPLIPKSMRPQVNNVRISNENWQQQLGKWNRGVPRQWTFKGMEGDGFWAPENYFDTSGEK